MRARFRPSHGTVVAYLALFVALGGTTYAATGGNFILGQSNSAGAPTVLSSPTTNSAGALKVANTSATTPGRGITALGGAGGFGLWASGGDASQNKAAIHGQSSAGNAVEGISGKNTASGVYGQNNSTGFGVAGRSTNGVGVMGDSSGGWAMQAFGNATQTRTKGGFVKAMAFIDPLGHEGDPVQQCFNSQLPPSQATSGDCGITWRQDEGTGDSVINFGFQVTDRVVSVTSAESDHFDTVSSPNSTSVEVRSQTGPEVGGAVNTCPCAFHILVY
jgi:hypothetical protein